MKSPASRRPPDTLVRRLVRFLPHDEDAMSVVVRAFQLAARQGANNEADAFLMLCREFVATYEPVRNAAKEEGEG